MKKLNAVFLAIILSFILAPSAHAGTLDEVKFYVENYYYKEIPANLDSMKTIEEVTNALDTYSYYMTKSEFDSYLKAIGEHMPADDSILMSSGLTNAVSSKTLYGHIGYIKISNFSTEMENTIDLHWTRLKNRGAQRLIIDLRDNLGGFVESAEELLGFFQGSKNAYNIYTREENKLVPTTPYTNQFPKETYILINKHSASASEIVAVSLKDEFASTLVGGKSFGKGTIQSFFQLGVNGGSGVLRLTTGEFKGPKGTTVNQIGIAPDIPTDIGKELTKAHGIALEKVLKKQRYTQMAPIKMTNPSAAIHINLPQPTNFQGSKSSHRVELVRLGGSAVPITFTQASDYQSISITAQETLSLDEEYMVILNPETKRLNGKRTKSGQYTRITSNSVAK
ncbi:S41 family peptidase [Sporosarcina sp. CAU 1771]